MGRRKRSQPDSLGHHRGQDSVKPRAQIAIALNPGKKIAHQLAKARALRGERHHALENAVAENLSSIETLRDARRQLSIPAALRRSEQRLVAFGLFS